jgi:hypothetical protein
MKINLKIRNKVSAPIHRSNPFENYIPFKPQSKSIVNIAKLQECTEKVLETDLDQYTPEELNILVQAQDAWIREYRAKMFKNVLGGK